MTTVERWIEQSPEAVREHFERIGVRWKEREEAGWDRQRYGRLITNELKSARGLSAEGGVRVSLLVAGPDETDRVVPDAFAVARSSPVPLGDESYTGVPDLVVEVLAADNGAGEDGQKKARYARAGVRHSWLVRLRWMTLEASVLGADGVCHAAGAGRLLPLGALPAPEDLRW